MSNQNINISIKNIVGKCDLKCSYNFKYKDSNSTAKNNGVMISLTYDSTGSSPVIYNNEKYNVSGIMIVSPSMHLFNNASMPGEIVISHTPVKGGKQLNVGIPFVSSSESSNASQLITDIIEKVASNAPSQGDSTNLNMSGFNLQNIVPKKSFFSYSAGPADWIVFGAIDAIPLSSTTLETLQKIIKPYPIPMIAADLFYNSSGPNSGLQVGDGIYISCQPTGSSEEETAVEYDKPSTSFDFSNILESPTLKLIIVIFIGMLLFLLIFFGINAFFNLLSPTVIKLPNIQKSS
jgi:carbonic anhydrase